MGDLFEIKSSKKIFHANNIKIFNGQINNSYPYIVRSTRNNGVRGFVVEDKKFLNQEETLSFAQDTFSVFYQKEKYFTGNKVKILQAKFKNKTSRILQYLASSFQYALQNLTWGTGSTVETIGELKVSIPIKNENLALTIENIDFNFMENFVAELEAQRIAELEAQRIAELEAYLLASGLKDTVLSDNEKQVFQTFLDGKIVWKKFKMSDLFDRVKTNKLPFKAKDLPKEATITHLLPCLTSSFHNQGLNYYVPRENATILKNLISIPSNSDVYRAYFQSREFTVLSDAYAIEWTYDENISPSHYLFMVACINKVTNLPIYSYKNKLGGWNVVKDKYILLPTNQNGNIDFDFMNTFIKAVQKEVIKGVVDFADEKIKTTKQAVNG